MQSVARGTQVGVVLLCIVCSLIYVCGCSTVNVLGECEALNICPKEFNPRKVMVVGDNPQYCQMFPSSYCELLRLIGTAKCKGK